MGSILMVFNEHDLILWQGWACLRVVWNENVKVIICLIRPRERTVWLLTTDTPAASRQQILHATIFSVNTNLNSDRQWMSSLFGRAWKQVPSKMFFILMTWKCKTWNIKLQHCKLLYHHNCMTFHRARSSSSHLNWTFLTRWSNDYFPVSSELHSWASKCKASLIQVLTCIAALHANNSRWTKF